MTHFLRDMRSNCEVLGETGLTCTKPVMQMINGSTLLNIFFSTDNGQAKYVPNQWTSKMLYTLHNYVHRSFNDVSMYCIIKS